MDRAGLSYHFPERGLDHAGAHELRAHTERCAARDSNSDLIVAHIDQLDTTCVVFQERSEYFVDDSLNRFTHPESMRKLPGQTQTFPFSGIGPDLGYTPRAKMQAAHAVAQMPSAAFSLVIDPVTP